MRNPNGYGGVSRLPGKRRRPYRARVTAEWVQGEDGRRIQRYLTLGYFATQVEAIRALADYNADPYSATLRRVTFKEVFDDWSEKYFEKYPGTRRLTQCAMAFCQKIWSVPMRDLRPAQLQEVITSMDGKSRGYQSKVRSLMHMLYKYAMGRDIVERDWSRYVELSAPERDSPRVIFTHEEIARLWALRSSGAPVPGEPPGYRGLGLLDSVLVLLYTGMRVGELLALRREQIHLPGRYIDLMGTKTKAARRRIPLHRDIVPVVKALLERGDSPYLVHGSRGEPLTYAQYKYGWFDKVMAGLNVRHTPHDTRHTFVSALDSAGVRRGAVKFIVGHSQRDVTDRYTHKDIAELIGEIDKIQY